MLDSAAYRTAIIAVIKSEDIEDFAKSDVLKVLCRDLGYAEGREQREIEAVTGKREKLDDKTGR